ncbi:hypothetical protein [Arthrobacter sp. TWP1-1]|uniref:hypothetical protein n=1 Tax=Arthrobacter sp. TWP1-1 TaxID=2804568 RepID=UPI003CEA8526
MTSLVELVETKGLSPRTAASLTGEAAVLRSPDVRFLLEVDPAQLYSRLPSAARSLCAQLVLSSAHGLPGAVLGTGSAHKGPSLTACAGFH